MQPKQSKIWIVIIATFTCLFLCHLAWQTYTPLGTWMQQQSPAPASSLSAAETLRVEQGEIHLGGWRAGLDSALKLAGPWHFRWKEFVAPGEAAAAWQQTTALSPVPGKWTDSTPQRGVTEYGYGTYLLKMSGVTGSPDALAMTLRWIPSAYRLYLVSGAGAEIRVEQLAANGNAGSDAMSSRPFMGARLIPLTLPADGDYYLVLHVANFHLAAQSHLMAPYLGTAAGELVRQNLRHVKNILLIGILLGCAFYLIGHFFQRRGDWASVSLAVFCLSAVGRIIASEGYFELLLGDSSPFVHELRFKVEYSMTGLNFGAYVYSLVYQFFTHYRRSLFIATTLVGLSFFCLIDLLPISLSSALLPYFIMALAPSAILVLIGMGRALRAREPEAVFTLVNVMPLMVGSIYDALVANGIVDGEYTLPYVMVFYVFVQSQIFGARYARALAKAEHLSASLQDEVQEQTRQLRSANQRLQEHDEQKTRFFQNISHELRTPLTLIMGPIDQLTRELPHNDLLRMARSNVGRLYRLVNQLLDWQKLAAGRYKINLTPVEITGFVKKCAEGFAPACEGRHIDFRFSAGSEEHVYVLGQVDAMEKILFNYLGNALKFTPDHGSIFLSMESSDEFIKIAVRDSGEGIPLEKQNQLFQVFSQVDNSTTRRYEGSGLGLALARELTEKMGGKVGVSSAAGAGSTFWMTLRRIRLDVRMIDVLFVDADPIVCDTFQNDLAQNRISAGYRVVGTLAEATCALEEMPAKLVMVSDLLPDGNGADLLRRIAEQHPCCRRILMTAEGEGRGVVQRAVQGGWVDQLVYKPWRMQEFIRILTAELAASPLQQPPTTESLARTLTAFDVPDERRCLDEGSSSQAGKAQILVVDDLSDMRLLVGAFLRREGYGVHSAVNGKDALNYLAGNTVDLVITDWMMPEMSGPDLIKVMKQDVRLSKIPVVLLTAKNDEESQLAGTQIGANAFIGKPFSEIELSSIVSNLLTLKESEREVEQLNRYLLERVLNRFLPQTIVDQIAAGKLVLETEPKSSIVTVMFADLCGFTHMTQTMSPTEVSRMLNTYFTAMTNVVFRNDGMVDKFIGDGMLVLFGAPIAMEPAQQAQHAFACALQMLDEIEAVNQAGVLLQPLALRLGIHQGEAVVGHIGSERRVDYTAVGATVNLASRIEGVAGQGEIFLSAQVRQHLAPEGWEEAGVFNLKGIDLPMQLYKAKRVAGKKAA